MGKFRKNKEVRKTVLEPLAEVLAELEEICSSWEEARKHRKIKRPDLYVNEGMAIKAIAILQKYNRELSGKLEDAMAGIYRYRDNERGNNEE